MTLEEDFLAITGNPTVAKLMTIPLLLPSDPLEEKDIAPVVRLIMGVDPDVMDPLVMAARLASIRSLLDEVDEGLGFD